MSYKLEFSLTETIYSQTGTYFPSTVMYFLYLVASYSAQSFTVAGIFLFATKSRPALRHNQPAYR